MGGSFSLHENSIGHFCDSPYVDGFYDASVHAASSLIISRIKISSMSIRRPFLWFA